MNGMSKENWLDCFRRRNNGESMVDIYKNVYLNHCEGKFATFERQFYRTKSEYASEIIREDCNNKLNEEDQLNNKNYENTKSVEYMKDGSTVFSGIIELMEGEPITPEAIARAHKLDSDFWEVIAYKSNFWQQQTKGSDSMVLYQSKVTVRPKKTPEITIEQIDIYFENKDYSKGLEPIKCLSYDEEGSILEIDLADPHVGLLSWRKESGSDYDLKIAEDRFRSCIADIVDRCKYTKIKKIYLVGLGDVLHIDNNNQTTTNGTFQQTDGRLEKITECAEEMLIYAITTLGILAPVEYVHICGNHDRLMGYMLARSLMNAFKNDVNVTFDISPDPIKSRAFGKTLVVFHHGDLPKKNTNTLPINFARNKISETKFTEVHCGHYHSQEVTSIGGVIVRYMPTIASSSYWEHQQGYKSDKAIMCYIWDEDKGLRDTWYVMV